MKHILSLLILSFSIGVNAQKVIRVNGTMLIDSTFQDSLTAYRFFEDSLHNTFQVEYVYAREPRVDVFVIDSIDVQRTGLHQHHIAICSIIAFKGNRKQTIASNIKAIYSPTDCASDNPGLWLKKFYELQNKKQ